MPGATRLTYPARTSSRWLGTSASAGSSRSVRRKRLDICSNTTVWVPFVRCAGRCDGQVARPYLRHAPARVGMGQVPWGEMDQAARFDLLRGVAQHYDWGSPTAIPELLGDDPDGRPWAELWFGTHEGGAAAVLHHGR